MLKFKIENSYLAHLETSSAQQCPRQASASSRRCKSVWQTERHDRLLLNVLGWKRCKAGRNMPWLLSCEKVCHRLNGDRKGLSIGASPHSSPQRWPHWTPLALHYPLEGLPNPQLLLPPALKAARLFFWQDLCTHCHIIMYIS